MPATDNQIADSIEPGTIPYGDRQVFEQSLGSPSPAPVPGAAAPDDTGLGIPGNPLDPLLSGELGSSQDPLTSGLSVGPGPGDMGGGEITDSTMERLRILALQARSPALRQLARTALRGISRELEGADL